MSANGLCPCIETAHTLKCHLAGLLAYGHHRVTNAVAEGMNRTIPLIKANAWGFCKFANNRIAIRFECGGLSLSPHNSSRSLSNKAI